LSLPVLDVRAGQGRAGQGAARLGVTLVFLANGSGFGAWAASIPAIKQALGLSGTALGGALLALGLGAVLAMPLAGWLGARRVPHLLSLGGLLQAALLPLPGLAGGLALLAASLLLLGACAGATDVCMNARASEVERASGRAIMSSFHAAFSLGGLVGAGVVAGMILAGFGALGGLLATSGLIVALMAAHAVLDRDATLAAPAARGGFAWPGWPLMGLGLLCLLAFMTEGAVGDWSGVFLAQVAGLPASAAASGFAAFSLAMIVGRLTGDRVVRRFGPAAVLRAGAALAAGGFGLAILLPWVAAAGFALVGLGAANMAPVLFSAAGRAGAAASTGVAVVATLGYAGFLLGPPAIGVLADLVGLRAAIGLLIAAVAAIAVCSGATLRNQPR